LFIEEFDDWVLGVRLTAPRKTPRPQVLWLRGFSDDAAVRQLKLLERGRIKEFRTETGGAA
jgi:hypothetical protein